MGCNCKDTAKAARKYTNEDTIVKLTGLNRLWYFIRKIITLILIFLIIIVMIPFIGIYYIVHTIRGKKTTINMKKLLKLHGKRK